MGWAQSPRLDPGLLNLGAGLMTQEGLGAALIQANRGAAEAPGGGRRSFDLCSGLRSPVTAMLVRSRQSHLTGALLQRRLLSTDTSVGSSRAYSAAVAMTSRTQYSTI